MSAVSGRIAGAVVVRPKASELASSAALAKTSTASDCRTRSGQIPGDESNQGIDGYGGKEFGGNKGFKTTLGNFNMRYC